MRQAGGPRLTVLVPISGLSAAELEERRSAIAARAGSACAVTVEVLADGPRAIETERDERAATRAVERHVEARVEDAGRRFTDALVVWCAGDPGVRAAQALVDVPVVGPGAAAFDLAASSAERFGVLVPLRENVAAFRRLLADSGMEPRCLGVASLDIPVLALRADRVRTLDRIEAIGRDMAGAGAYVLGCMGLFGMGPPAARRLGVLVIDPLEAAVGTAVRRMAASAPVAESGASR